MTTTFENADVGDRVWSYDQGWGTIKSIDLEREYPIHVIFDNCSHYTFPISGEFSEYVSRQLFWDEIKYEIPTQPPRMKLVREYDTYLTNLGMSYPHTEKIKQAEMLGIKE
jgi:hypothetical protein